MKGLVVEEHVDRIVVSTVDGEQVLRRRDIDEVFFDDPERNYLYLGNEALADGDLNTALTLFRKAWQFNPRLEEAQDALSRAEEARQKAAMDWTTADPERALWTRWGLRLTATDRAPVVSTVDPQRLADRAGLLVGDQMIAVWGDSMAYRPLPQVAERLLGPAGTPVKVTVQRRVTVAPEVTPKAPWPGFELTMAPAGLTVARVESRGEAAGLRVNDLIVLLNGHPTRYLPLASAQTAVKAAHAGGLQLEIHRHLLITRPQDVSDYIDKGVREEIHG